MIRELLICSALGVPHAPSTQKQRKKMPLEVSIKHSGCRKQASLPSRQDPLLKHAGGGAQRSSKFKHQPSSFALILQPAQTIKARTHAAVWNAINAHTNAHLLLLVCVLSSLSFYLCSSRQVCKDWAERAEEQRETGSADERERWRCGGKIH